MSLPSKALGLLCYVAWGLQIMGLHLVFGCFSAVPEIPAHPNDRASILKLEGETALATPTPKLKTLKGHMSYNLNSLQGYI